MDADWPHAGGVMAARLRTFDWTASGLGPPARWSEGLRTAVGLMLEAPLASATLCGHERRLIHNDAAAALIGDRDVLAAPLAEVWPEARALALACDRAFAGEASAGLLWPGETPGGESALTPIRDAAGQVIAALLQRLAPAGSAADAQHRIRNLLAVVRATVARTAETTDSVDDFANHLLGRLDAVARTQAILTRAPMGGVDLENLVRDELHAQAADDRRVAIAGPEVRLSAKAAEVLTLAVHELATNAIKHGALAATSGRIDIRWRVEPRRGGRPWLAFSWSEAGVRVATIAPRREGFGLRLIQQRIPYELGGTGAHRLAPGGVICDIEIPLEPGSAHSGPSEVRT